MQIIVSLKDDEKIIFNEPVEKVLFLRSHDCKKPYNHVFYADPGKLMSFTETELFENILERNEPVAIFQNRRYFKEIARMKDSIVDENDIFLPHGWNFGNQSILEQFKQAHWDTPENFFEKAIELR